MLVTFIFLQIIFLNTVKTALLIVEHNFQQVLSHLVTASVRATVGQAARTSRRARTSRGSKGLVYYEIIDYIINAPSRGSEEKRMGIPCW